MGQVLSGALSANGSSGWMYVRPGESLDFAVTGTFSANVRLDFSQSPSTTIDTPLTLTAAGSSRRTTSTGGYYRARVSDYASGTVNYSLTQVNDVLFDHRGDDGKGVILSEEGVNLVGTNNLINGIVSAGLISVDVTCTAAALDASTGTGKVNVIAAAVAGSPNITDQYKIRGITLVGGGTSFGAGGDRLLSLTDGTTVWTTVPNANLESAPATSVAWGNAAIPFLTGTSNTASAAGAQIYFQYSGGTPATPHTTGSISFNVLLEKVA